MPQDGRRVTWYCQGPIVYDAAHGEQVGTRPPPRLQAEALAPSLQVEASHSADALWEKKAQANKQR